MENFKRFWILKRKSVSVLISFEAVSNSYYPWLYLKAYHFCDFIDNTNKMVSFTIKDWTWKYCVKFSQSGFSGEMSNYKNSDPVSLQYKRCLSTLIVFESITYVLLIYSTNKWIHLQLKYLNIQGFWDTVYYYSC